MDDGRDELIVNNLELIYFVLKKLNLYDKRDYYYDIGLMRFSRCC